MPPNRSTRARDRRQDLLLEADVTDARQRLAAGGLDLGDHLVDGAGQLGIRLGGLSNHRHVGPIARRPQRDGSADAAAGPRDEQGLPFQRSHTPHLVTSY